MNLLQPHTIVKEGPFLSHRKSLHLTWRRSGSTTGNWKLARRSVACGISRCLGWLCALGSVAGGLCLGLAESPSGQGSSLLPWLGEIKKIDWVLCPWRWNSQQWLSSEHKLLTQQSFFLKLHSWAESSVSLLVPLNFLFLLCLLYFCCPAQPTSDTELSSSVCVALGFHLLFHGMMNHGCSEWDVCFIVLTTLQGVF